MARNEDAACDGWRSLRGRVCVGKGGGGGVFGGRGGHGGGRERGWEGAKLEKQMNGQRQVG